jgi:hypothetical protein
MDEAEFGVMDVSARMVLIGMYLREIGRDVVDWIDLA